MKNTDKTYLPRSIVTGLAYVMKGNDKSGKFFDYWHQVRRDNGKKQTNESELLVARANVQIPESGCGIVEIRKFQSYLASLKVAIVVFLFQTFGKKGDIFFYGVKELEEIGIKPDKTVNIMYYEESRHFKPILSLIGASGCKRYCELCNFGYDNFWHECREKCVKWSQDNFSRHLARKNDLRHGKTLRNMS